jgi:hypothetical protein
MIAAGQDKCPKFQALALPDGDLAMPAFDNASLAE